MSNQPRRRLVVALSVLTMMLGVAFIPTLFAQRVAQRQQEAPLKTLTLDGKVGTNRSTDPQVGQRARPLSQAQRATLFKGKARAATQSYMLTPKQPTFSDKASLRFTWPIEVSSYGVSATFQGGSEGRVYLSFRAKAGQLYALDITVWVPAHVTTGTYTITNSNVQGVTQTIPVEPNPYFGQHITAYVTAAQDGSLAYDLQCSETWVFQSIEVTEL